MKLFSLFEEKLHLRAYPDSLAPEAPEDILHPSYTSCSSCAEMSDKPNAPLVIFIQVVGLTAAAVFGVFSALAWSQAVKAGYEATAGNTIAMFTLCNSQV